MIRVSDLKQSLHFFCNILSFKEVRRSEYEKGRFTLVFLVAESDYGDVLKSNIPMIELTYNWPDENGNVESYDNGRNFGHLAYGVDNIYETCQKLIDKGVRINRPPKDGRMAFVKTPDGISLEILQMGDPLPLKEPWLSMNNFGEW